MNWNSPTALLLLSPRGLLDAAKNLLLWRRLAKNPEALVVWNLYFDPERYLAVHNDVAKAGIDPLIHFLLRGNPEYRDPCPAFNVRSYLGRYPEVAAAHVNALLHFALFGSREGRSAGGQAFAMFSPTARRVGSVAALSVNNDWIRDQPLLSVVIPCFNYGKYVEAAIRSVLDQTYTNLEVIVVDGGSTETATLDELRRLESLQLPKTRFYYRAERHLVGDNRNFGIRMATGRYVCCLDADDTLLSPYLEAAVFLAEVFGWDIVSPSVQCCGGSSLKWLLVDPGFPGILRENQVATVALFRRSAWAHVGGYRDWGTGRLYIPEDWDFWIRLLGHGYRGTAIPETLMLCRVHEGSLSHGRRTATAEQRRTLQIANESLWTAGPATNDPRFVVNPWANLGPDPDETQGFLIALPFISIGGAEKLFRTLLKGIALSGRRIVVITTLTLPDSIPDDSGSFEKLTPHVYHLSRLFSNDMARYGFLRYLIHRYSVSTMMLAGCEFVYPLLPAIREEFPDLSVVDQLFNDSVHARNNRLFSESIDATFVPSQRLRESLAAMSEATSASIHVIPHGIELPEESGEVARELPAAARGKLIVGYFGRLSVEKGPDIFIEIVRKLAGQPNLFFVMTGTGPESQAVMAKIREYRLQDRIYAPGFVEDVTPLMRAADIVVLPSRLDGMPLAVIEAQALGKPVVASRVGSLGSMIEDQKTGFLCEPGDIREFEKRILELAGDKALRDRMKSAARQLTVSKCGADRMLESYERVFQSAGRSGRRDEQ